MSNIMLDAAKDVERFGRMFPGLAKLGPELERVGSLQQAADEATARAAAAEKKRSETQAAVDALEAKLTEAHADVDRKLEATTQQANQVTEQAKADAARTIADAGRLLDEARENVQSLLNEAHGKADEIVNAAKTEAESYNEKIEAGKRALDDLASQIATKQATLDSVNAHLDEVRSKL